MLSLPGFQSCDLIFHWLKTEFSFLVIFLHFSFLSLLNSASLFFAFFCPHAISSFKLSVSSLSLCGGLSQLVETNYEKTWRNSVISFIHISFFSSSILRDFMAAFWIIFMFMELEIFLFYMDNIRQVWWLSWWRPKLWLRLCCLKYPLTKSTIFALDTYTPPLFFLLGVCV